MEIFGVAIIVLMLPSLLVFMVGAAIVLYILIGYPGLIGLFFILLEIFLIH